jgi:hypothetical protein
VSKFRLLLEQSPGHTIRLFAVWDAPALGEFARIGQ